MNTVPFKAEGGTGLKRSVPLPTAEDRIQIRNVSRSFRRARSDTVVQALHDVSLGVAANTFVSLVGPSGCGKTTLLRMLNGLILPDEGEILIDGAPPRPGPHTGFVFQSFRLLPWRTVRANVAFALEAAGLKGKEYDERVQRYLEVVGLRRFADSFPSELSGGMKQRVALARALVVEPQFLLMDEPFASLDAQTREFMQFELMRLWNRRKAVVIFVTHSVDEAILLSEKVVLLRPRPGEVAEVLDIPLPQPRWEYDVRSHPDFIELRRYLWDRIKQMVADDPQSEFFGRVEENA